MDTANRDVGYLKVYTREAKKDSYPYGLAFGIHMACSEDGKEFRPFNKNYGILFAEAIILPDDTLSPRGVKEPKAFALVEGGFGIIAERVVENGEPDWDCAGKVLMWTTKDWIRFEAKGLLPVDEAKRMAARDGGQPTNCVEVEQAVLMRAAEYWNPVYHTQTIVPECVKLSSVQELDAVMALALYSDGSCVKKRVRWEKESVDFSIPESMRYREAYGAKSIPFRWRKALEIPFFSGGRESGIIPRRTIIQAISACMSGKRIR